MTDPFKNQRYSFQNSNEFNNFSANSIYQESSMHSSSVNPSSLKTVPSSPELMNRLNNQLKELNEFTSSKNLDYSNRVEFQQAFIHSNKELIKQLKSNNELLFKGAKLVSQFILYPLRALRWQCQIHSESSKFHLTPITLMPVFYNMSYHGYYTLWKGCFSMAAYNGIKTILESIIHEVSPCEKNFEDVNVPNKIYGHIALKAIASALTTPIFSAVIYESVQSGISNENIGLTDLLRETWNRITGYKYNYRTRLIPFWSLILPTSSYFVGLHFLSIGLEKIFHKSILVLNQIFNDKRRLLGIDEVESEVVDSPYFKTLAEVASHIGSIVMLYPIETILNRLIVQGTRTIIDNTDTGYGVVPINTRYDGFFDCASTINQTEGFFGFYKGIGAIVVEALLHYAILKLAKTIALHIFDSEWTTRSDMNNIKNLMTSSSSSNSVNNN